VALQKGKGMPLEAEEAFVFTEMNCRPSLAELDLMPQTLIDTVLLYGAVKSTVQYGGRLKL